MTKPSGGSGVARVDGDAGGGGAPAKGGSDGAPARGGAGGLPPGMAAMLDAFKEALIHGLGPRNVYQPKEIERVRGYALLTASLAGPTAPGLSNAARIVGIYPEAVAVGQPLTVVLENADLDGDVGFVGAAGPAVLADVVAAAREGTLTELTVVVPAGAATGPITVSTTTGPVTSSSPLTVDANVPARVLGRPELYIAIAGRP